MTKSVQQWINSFEQFSSLEKQEAVAEILRRSTPAEYGPLTDDDLMALADAVFVSLDEEEARAKS